MHNYGGYYSVVTMGKFNFQKYIDWNWLGNLTTVKVKYRFIYCHRIDGKEEQWILKVTKAGNEEINKVPKRKGW